MSIGLGLLLGLALVSTTILYVATRDRWRWKRIVGVVVSVVVGLPVVGIGAYYVWQQLPKPIVPASELWGIQLGMPRKEVLFRKGPPSDSASSRSGSGHVGEIWLYRQEYAPVYAIRFERDSVWLVEGDKTAASGAPSVSGLTGYESQEDAVRKLGAPTGVSTSADGKTRILSFARRRVFIVLERNQVTGVGIYRPDGPGGVIRWTEEDTTVSR